MIWEEEKKTARQCKENAWFVEKSIGLGNGPDTRPYGLRFAAAGGLGLGQVSLDEDPSFNRLEENQSSQFIVAWREREKIRRFVLMGNLVWPATANVAFPSND
jgi:hypothetical protein